MCSSGSPISDPLPSTELPADAGQIEIHIVEIFRVVLTSEIDYLLIDHEG